MILLLVIETFYLLESALRCNFWKSSKKRWGTLIFSVTIGGWKRGQVKFKKDDKGTSI